eukprot:COSAG01_NODE_243_length_20572_cov_24.956137_11_plen_250_part_00
MRSHRLAREHYASEHNGHVCLTFTVYAAVVMSLIIGNMSDIIAHANPGQTATKEALGKVHAFLHDRHVPSMLSRRIRAHFSVYYAERGTTEDMTEIFKILPTDMQVELATALRFVSDEKVGLKGVFSKVPFFCNLQPSDLIKIGVKMRHQQCFQVSSAGSEEQPVANFIMKEGDRTSEMWIVVDGSVHVERSGSDQSAMRIGKLRVNDIFGEVRSLLLYYNHCNRCCVLCMYVALRVLTARCMARSWLC